MVRCGVHHSKGVLMFLVWTPCCSHCCVFNSSMLPCLDFRLFVILLNLLF
jgi:hypothetical protein